MLFGAHISVAGGYEGALDYAFEVGCECAQIFAKSPRQWKGPLPDPAKAEAFVAARLRRGFGPLFTHTAYLINPATPEPELREKSIVALADELVRGALLGASGVVTHIGSDPLGDPDAAAHRVADAVNRAFELAGPAADSTRLLLENTAGAGRTFGSTFEELGNCIDLAGLPVEKLGVCLDTCHAFAFGMPLDTAEGWVTVIDGSYRVLRACTAGPDPRERLHVRARVQARPSCLDRGRTHRPYRFRGDGVSASTRRRMCVH